jgi:hypothetical protein
VHVGLLSDGSAAQRENQGEHPFLPWHVFVDQTEHRGWEHGVDEMQAIVCCLAMAYDVGQHVLWAIFATYQVRADDSARADQPQ